MKRNRRRIKGTVITALAILLFILTGCGGNPKNREDIAQGLDEPENTVIFVQEPREESWQAEYFRLENRYDLAVAAGNLYGMSTKDRQVFIDSIDKESFSVEDSFVLPGGSSLSGMTADAEGNVYLLGDQGETAGFWKIDTEGKLQEFTEIELEDTEDADDILLKGIYADRSGKLYVWCEMFVPELELVGDIEETVWHCEDRVYVKDGQLNPVFYAKIADMRGTQVLSFQMVSEDRPLFIVKDGEDLFTQEIDAGRGGLKDEVLLDKLDESFDEGYIYGMENIAAVDNGFLYCQGNTLYELHYDMQRPEKVLGLSTYGISASDLLFLSKSGDVIEMIDNHGDSGYSEYISFRMGVSKKQALTLGMTMSAQDLEQAVMEFNRYNGEYVVETVDYAAAAGSYESGLEQLKLDVATGKAPDIISVSGIDSTILSDKGVLADLYEFMRRDGECTEDMLVQSVIEAYEVDGRLYSIAPSFQLHTMWGYSDVTAGREGVTFRELFQLLEDSGKDMNAITGFSADEPVLTRLCTVSMDEFVDWENKTCSFDGEYFKEVLAFAKEYKGNNAGGTYAERIRKREVVMSIGILSSVADYQIEEELYGKDVGFIGYPVADGSGTAIAFRNSDVAINARKENQEGAWEFVKFYLLHGYDGQGFPVVKQQFDRVMEAAMEEDYDASGSDGTQKSPKASLYNGGDMIFVYAAAQEEVDAVVRLVERAKNRVEPHAEIQSIINEEAAVYFSGQVDLDRTAEKIQNRISLLLQE